MPINNSIVISAANELGFDLVGFSELKKLTKETEYLKKWLSLKYNGGMKYLENRIEFRENPSLIFDKTKSIISLAINYYSGEKHTNKTSNYKISRYAWGKDYHFIMWDKIKVLIEKIKIDYPDFEAVNYVDTGPVLDKVWAVNSGLGWMGKNTNVINKNIGSWFVIGNLFTNVEFNNYSKPQEDFCGSCNKCVSACPTDALFDNYQIDGSKCISYLTIENKNEIPIEFKGKLENWILGCDICQEVCPWNNKFSQLSKEVNFLNGENVEFTESEIVGLSSKEFKEKFKESPILRPKLKGMIRNINFNKVDNDETF